MKKKSKLKMFKSTPAFCIEVLFTLRYTKGLK
ncbi:MAG: hypothetical protein E7539_03520 [Ruminococcaceae bacterium]|nr:hypothetical protein [Oscillospiraceae bacterium]